MNADDGRAEVDEIDPADLLDYLEPTEEAFLYTDGPTTPALIETLTPGDSLSAWITITDAGADLHLSDRGAPVASCDGFGHWTLSDPELPIRGDDFDPTEPTPLNLVYSLLSLGWRINAVAETGRVTVKALPPMSWDATRTELAWQARGLSPASPVNIVLLRSDAEQFALDEASSGVKGPDGSPAPIDFDDLLGIALAIAPTQFMPDAVAAAPNWHSAGCATPQTSLPTDPHAIDDNDDDVGARKQHLKGWLESHNMRGPFATRAEVSEFIADHNPVGHYVLEFTNGSCYIGETVNFRERFATHSKTYDGQIESFHLRYDPTAAALPARSKARKQQLINVERKLIHDAQKVSLVARNFREMANPIEPSPEFTALFAGGTAHEKIAQWFAHPDEVNASDPTSLQPFRTADFGGAKDKFDRLLKLPEADQIMRVVSAYLSRCVPFPAMTEYRSWSISCLPSAKRGRPGAKYSVLACLSISRTESLTILREDWSQQVIGFVQVNEIEADFVSGLGLVRLLRHHPEVAISPADYSEFGPGTATLHADSLDALERLLDDTRITRAAATSALRLCRLGPSTQRAVHNPYLVERALGQSRAWT
ncbi:MULTISPECIES: GIY-YIG nuclease family protein [Gordonia]|uniref:GIY-YIG nuclease family protein n=1 Tax=Gordonia TaxID=2053 RepID=UPI00257ADD13|nr:MULTISPECIES: hypothetical protein [Gordonia]